MALPLPPGERTAGAQADPRHGRRRLRRGARACLPLDRAGARYRRRSAPCERQARGRRRGAQRAGRGAARRGDAGHGRPRGAAAPLEGEAGRTRADGLNPHQAQRGNQLSSLGARRVRLRSEAGFKPRDHDLSRLPSGGHPQDQGARPRTHGGRSLGGSGPGRAAHGGSISTSGPFRSCRRGRSASGVPPAGRKCWDAFWRV